jgi:hypothetical protein
MSFEVVRMLPEKLLPNLKPPLASGNHMIEGQLSEPNVSHHVTQGASLVLG